MPAPLAAALPYIIAGAATLAGSVTSSLSARNQQRRQMRQDERFWQMQNNYNNPQAQMRRFQEAGLNPNLVYGQSSGGAAGQAERLKTPDMDPAAHKWIEPQGIMPMITGYADLEVKQAQTDNLKAQTQVAQENAILTAQKSYGEGVRNARTKFDLEMVENLKQNSLDAAGEQLRKLKIDNQYTLNQDERAGIALANSTKQAVESVLTSRLGRQLTSLEMKKLSQDNQIRELDVKLSDMGVRPTDPFYARSIVRLVNKFNHFGGNMKRDYHQYLQDPSQWRMRHENEYLRKKGYR